MPLNGTVSTLAGTAHLWTDGLQHVAIGEDWVVASTVQGEGWVAYLLTTGDESGEDGPQVDKRAGGGGGGGSSSGATAGARGGSSSSGGGGSKGGGASSGGRTGPPSGSRPASNRPNGVNGVNGVDGDGGGGGSDDSGGGSGGSGNKGGSFPSTGSRGAASAVSGRASSIPTGFRWSSAQGVRASGALLVCAFVLASVLT